MQNRKRDTDVQNRLLDSEGEGEGGMFRENSIETCILSRVKQTTSPGWMHETSAWAWCTGKTQRDWVEREVGGGIGMGNTCNSMADSCPMTKTTTTFKVISLQLIKINVKKKFSRDVISRWSHWDPVLLPGPGLPSAITPPLNTPAISSGLCIHQVSVGFACAHIMTPASDFLKAVSKPPYKLVPSPAKSPAAGQDPPHDPGL